MKKVLFASTALVAAGLMTSGTATAAEKIQLQLGGFAKWWVVGAWNDDSYVTATATATVPDYANVDVKGDVEVHFSGSTTLDNGLKVGVKIELEGGGVTQVTSDTIDKSFAWVEGGFGKVIIGVEANGTKLLHVAAPEAAGTSQAAAGSISAGNALAAPGNVNVINETAINTDGEKEKITYVAPSFMGLTVGASYSGDVLVEDNPGVATASELFGVGALYANTFGGVGLKVSGGWGQYDISASTNSSYEWTAGTQISYAGFTVGGSYRRKANNYQGDVASVGGGTGNAAVNITTSSDGFAWDAGIQYASGPYAVSFNYYTSEVEGAIANVDKDVLTIYQVSAKYTLGPGVDVLATVGRGEYDDETVKNTNYDSNHNEGWVVMTGLSLTF